MGKQLFLIPVYEKYAGRISSLLEEVCEDQALPQENRDALTSKLNSAKYHCLGKIEYLNGNWKPDNNCQDGSSNVVNF